jgi:cellulose synthase/poly-beta-1,6-N-acetylglucosamine synthase-like glycosyltransferase
VTCRFLAERLVYGMAPEDIEGVFKQRLRWAMGALQVNHQSMGFDGCLYVSSIVATMDAKKGSKCPSTGSLFEEQQLTVEVSLAFAADSPQG